MTTQESPIACRMSALTPEQHARRRELVSLLRPVVGQIVAMPDGYALRLPDKDDVLLQATELVTLERRCCPFLKFQIEIEAEEGGAWLRLTGREGVKDFLAAEFGFDSW
jgi:hypothetical protein